MHRLLVSLFALALAAALPRAEADEAPPNVVLEGKVVVNAPTAAPVNIYARVAFVGNYAVAAPVLEDATAAPDFKAGTVFDLKKGAWHHNEKGAWVDLEACRQWEAASMEMSKKSLANAPSDDFRDFVEAMIEPNFAVTEQAGGEVVISNSHFKYVVSPNADASPAELSRFLAYDRLNAYQRPMTERGFPPTPTLAVDDVLAERKIFPAKLTASIWSPKGDVKMTSDWKIKPITPEITADVEAAIEAASHQTK